MRLHADEAGHYRYTLPREYGGIDSTNLAMAIIREHLAARDSGCTTICRTGGRSSIVSNVPDRADVSRLRRRETEGGGTPKLLNGSMRIAFGLTEPDHGSDATSIETRGVRDGNQWRITGTKALNKRLHVATSAFVFARTVARTAARAESPSSSFDQRAQASRSKGICGRSICPPIIRSCR